MFQMKEHDKISEKELNKVQTSNPLDKKFKIMVKKMLNELRRRKDEHSENFNMKLENKEEPNRAEEYNK